MLAKNHLNYHKLFKKLVSIIKEVNMVKVTKYCSDCNNLDGKKKSAGKTSGNLYYCKKLKTYVNPTQVGYDKFETCYNRRWYEKK